jgi:hypothetical protein
MVHGIRAMLDLHPNWVVLNVDVYNAFNLVSWSTNFQEFQSLFGFLDLFFPFV